MRRKRYSIDLAADMAECEANYARLMRLLPDMQNLDEGIDACRYEVALPGHSPAQMHIKVLEHCKYTTMLEVVHHLPQGSSGLPQAFCGPTEFSLRVYHDARMAEVVAFNKRRRIQPRYEYPNRQMHQRDEKAQLNHFLGEWLSYCLQHGRAQSQALSNWVTRA